MKISEVMIVLLLILTLAIFGVYVFEIYNSDLPTWTKLWLIFFD